MNVMVCGSREWGDYSAVRDRLARLERNDVILHGCAWGADACADDAASELGLTVRPFPPNAARPSPRRYHERNDAMLNEADLVLAFWDGKSRGTGSVIKKAEKRGIPVEVVRDGAGEA